MGTDRLPFQKEHVMNPNRTLWPSHPQLPFCCRVKNALPNNITALVVTLAWHLRELPGRQTSGHDGQLEGKEKWKISAKFAQIYRWLLLTVLSKLMIYKKKEIITGPCSAYHISFPWWRMKNRKLWDWIFCFLKCLFIFFFLLVRQTHNLHHFSKVLHALHEMENWKIENWQISVSVGTSSSELVSQLTSHWPVAAAVSDSLYATSAGGVNWWGMFQVYAVLYCAKALGQAWRNTVK